MEENKEKELEEIKKKFFKDIQDETNIYNINKFLEEEDAKIIVPILKKINEYFLRNYEIRIGNLKVCPIETEIYFANNSYHGHGACHESIYQKNKFGKLYFHRYKDSEKIICVSTDTRGGVDVCISDGEYYLSILIRSAYVNNDLVIGTRNVVDKILQNKDNNIDRLKKIENSIKLIKSKKNLNKEIMNHCRIKGTEYFSSYNYLKQAELNCFLEEEQGNLAKKNNIYKLDNFRKK